MIFKSKMERSADTVARFAKTFGEGKPDWKIPDELAAAMDVCGISAKEFEKMVDTARARKASRAELAAAPAHTALLCEKVAAARAAYSKATDAAAAAGHAARAFEGELSAYIDETANHTAYLHASAPEYLREALEAARRAGGSLTKSNQVRRELLQLKSIPLRNKDGLPMWPPNKVKELENQISDGEKLLAKLLAAAPREQVAIDAAIAAIEAY